jgi:N4-(beta-N-acetylglucosaminyl)-L-asparaginase
MKTISRRKFFHTGLGVGAAALLTRGLSCTEAGERKQIPLIITSHTNETGEKAAKLGWKILSQGGTALDAVEKAANFIELDAEGTGVGYGGLPNEAGVVQLDASIMNGRTYSAGSVACLENIKTPCSVARIVMEKTDHVMLVGKNALEFAKKWGFQEEDLLTEKARERWLRWKQGLSERDDWGAPEHLKDLEISEGLGDDEYNTGTTNVLAVDKNGDVAGVTTTSGLSFKIPGRVGDSPIIGAGLYVDNEVGAAGATGRGEDVIKCCASFYMVMRMKEGSTPQQACEEALKMMIEKYKKVNPNFFPGEQFVAINKKGEVGCCKTQGEQVASMSVMNAGGYRIHEGTVAFPTE